MASHWIDEDKFALGPEAVREQLSRILGSCAFDASKRNRRFLEYAVEEALAGRADRIKAYNIATTVFGRDASFDPQLDSIVRIEAGRLRRSLERYYLTAGQQGPRSDNHPDGLVRSDIQGRSDPGRRPWTLLRLLQQRAGGTLARMVEPSS